MNEVRYYKAINNGSIRPEAVKYKSKSFAAKTAMWLVRNYEMAEIKLDSSSLKDGIYILSEINNEFEKIYLQVRDKENRIFSDDEVKNLPFASDSNPHKKEWDLRAKSFQRFKEYLKSKKQNLNILDLGCGNGWFSGQLSKTFNHRFLLC
ncbi:MAG: hypothetical protein MZV64_74030 [Ignavibacteriales bacterium]|nr:hypothetical protein [Ignavibacteriales bacterium]